VSPLAFDGAPLDSSQVDRVTVGMEGGATSPYWDMTQKETEVALDEPDELEFQQQSPVQLPECHM